MAARFLFLLFITISSMTYAEVDSTENCKTALEELFTNGEGKITEEKAGEFLALQGELTLHRLAWAYLKAQGQDDNDKLDSVENTIISLLDQKYTSTDAGFIAARDSFEAQPLSRATLSEIAPYLKDFLGKEFGEENEKFVLNISDLKLLGILAKFEKSSVKNGHYDDRLLSRKSPQSMLNFLKLINSSYSPSLNKDENKLSLALREDGLEKNIEKMQASLFDFISQVKLPAECTNVCQDDDELNQIALEIYMKVVNDTLPSDDTLLDNLGYGHIWLKTGMAQASKTTPPVSVRITRSGTKQVSKTVWSPPVVQPTVEHNSKTVATRPAPAAIKGSPFPFGKFEMPLPPKAKTTSTVKAYYGSETGLIIEDPLAIIIKDNPKRTRAGWSKFDKEFQMAMADAILNKSQVFEYKGQLHERSTGKSISPQAAISKYLKFPKNRKYPALNNFRPETPGGMQLVKAILNKDETFIFNNKLYSISGVELNPAKEISDHMAEVYNMKFTPERYKGLSTLFVNLRANALANGKPYFKIKNDVFDSQTGFSINSPFRQSAPRVNADRAQRNLYSSISDKEVILNFHRDNPSPGCQHYAIVDKKAAMVSVYNKKGGNPVFKTEILLGSEKSDKYGRWTNYEKRITNYSTGAGIFTITQPHIKDPYYKTTFENRILQVVDEEKRDQVFAIHQVPVNLQSRYSSFGTGNPQDRRITGTCGNLKKSDYDKIVQWLKPSCQIYVLPEEAHNGFVVKDKKLVLTQVKKIPASLANGKNFNPAEVYHYSKVKPVPRPITITLNQSVSTPTTRTFVNTLAAEKAKLMKIYGFTNDEYDDLARLSFAIMGNETDFGESTKFKIKENAQGLVIGAKFASMQWDSLTESKAQFLSSVTNLFAYKILPASDLDKASNTSRGFTQIKILPVDDLKKHYPGITKENLTDPKNSAIATMIYLSKALSSIKTIAMNNSVNPKRVQITQANMIEMIGYLYTGRGKALRSEDDPATPESNLYVQGLYRNLKLINVRSKN